MSDPIPGIAAKLYRVFTAGDSTAPKWGDILHADYERWVQVAASACIAALGSDHLTNALADTRAELAKRDAEIERLRAENGDLKRVAEQSRQLHAADEAEIKRLTAANLILLEENRQLRDTQDTEEDELDCVEADNARLREALGRVLDWVRVVHETPITQGAERSLDLIRGGARAVELEFLPILEGKCPE